MAATPLTTWKDLIDHLVDWCGANPGAEAHRDARRASLGGLRELATAHRWSSVYGRGRLATNAPYSAGTVGYDHTGGAQERLLTLSGGTWPAWAALGALAVGDVVYEVASRVSDAQLTLASASNPGEDLAAGTSYVLYRDTYPLPSDLVSLGVVTVAGHDRTLRFEHPDVWLERQRVYRGQAEPCVYCVTGSPDHLGSMAIRLYPAPDQAYSLDYVYQRQPRALQVDEHKQGTVSTTAGSASVTGSGTAWASRHVGTVFRVSRNNTEHPTGPAGGNPSVCQRVVASVNSATSITLDSAVPESLGPVKYLLSDPVDVEAGAMLTALHRSIEHQMAHARRMADVGRAEQAYNRALILAREADSRSFRLEWAGQNDWQRLRLADMPRGADVP